MNGQRFATGAIGILAVLLLTAAGVGAWVLLRPKPAPPIPAKDVFAHRLAGMLEEPQPIPALRQTPDADAQRARQLHLLTIDFTGTLGDLLDAVRKQTEHKFSPGEIDLAKRVRIVARAWPVIRVLNEAGVEPDVTGTLKSYSALSGTKYVDGARFSFSAWRWEPEGKPLGWIIRTDARIDLPWSKHPSTVTWDLGSIETDAAVPFERCGVHSPRLVYVANSDLGPFKVRVSGSRSWYLDVPIEFRQPNNGDTWRGHGFNVTLRWPDIEVKADRPLPSERLEGCLSRSDVYLYLRDRQPLFDSMTIGGGAGGGGRYGGRFGGRKDVTYAWCGCVDTPAKSEPSVVKMSQSMAIPADTDPKTLGAYASIQLDFRALIEEEFEVVSDPLPTK